MRSYQNVVLKSQGWWGGTGCLLCFVFVSHSCYKQCVRHWERYGRDLTFAAPAYLSADVLKHERCHICGNYFLWLFRFTYRKQDYF
jgi:hypothetical protein